MSDNNERLKEQLKKNDGREKIKVLLELANASIDHSNADSFQYAEKAFNLAQENKYTEGESEALRYIGNSFFRIGDYSEALRSFQQALSIEKKLNRTDQIAGMLNNIAMVLGQTGSLDQAIEHLHKALDLQKKNGGDEGIARTYNNLGTCYKKLKNYDKSLDYYYKSLSIAKEANQPKIIALMLTNIAAIFSQQGKNNQALERFQEAYQIRKNLEDSYGIASSSMYISECLLKMGEIDEAMLYTEECVNLAEAENFKWLLKTGYRLLSSAFERKGESEKALNFHKRFTELKDALYSEENARNIAQMQAHYDAQQKTAEIEALEIKVRERTSELEARKETLEHEINERRQIENELRENEDRYRNLFQNAQVGLFRTRVEDGKILESNDRLVEMFGYEDRKEFVGRYYTSKNYVDPGTREKMLEIIENNGRVENFEARFYRKDGSAFWAKYSAHIDREKGWIEGVAEDITDLKEAQKENKNRLEFEKTIARISSKFVGIKNIDAAINDSLADIGKISGADRAYLFQFSLNGLAMDNTHEWCAENVNPQIDNLKDLPVDMFPWWMKKLENDEIIHITNVSKMPPEASVEKEILESQDVKSLLVMPVKSGMGLVGFLGFDNVTRTGRWSKYNLNNLRISSEIIGRAIEHNRAEKALQKSENRFRVALEGSPIIVWNQDKELRYSWIYNPHPAFKIEDTIGKTDEQLFPADNAAHLTKIKRSVLETGVPAREEVCNIIEGNSYYYDLYIEPLRDANGGVEEIACASLDITERKRIEKALMESEVQFRTIVEGTNACLFRTDRRGRFTYANEAAFRTLDCSRDDLIGKFYLNFVHKEDKKLIHDQVLGLTSKNSGEVNTELRFETQKGSVGWFIFLINPVVDKGQVTGFNGVAQDVTELKKIDRDLQKSRNRLSGIIEAIPDFMSIINRDFNILWANENVKKTFGGDFGDKKCYETYHRFEKPCKDCIIAKVFEDGKTHRHETEAVSAAGEKIYELSIASPVSKDADGKIETVIEVSRDMTEYKKLEEQYQQVQKMESVGRLAGGVAHDFNNLLTVISGHAQMMLLSIENDDPFKPDVQEISDAADRAANLTNQLLIFSRRHEVQLKPQNINKSISNITKMVKRLIGEDIDLKTKLKRNLWKANIDEGQMEQVIVNMCLNARDAMPNGGNLVISTDNKTVENEYSEINPEIKTGDYVLLTISDTGCGMTEEVASRVFDPFYTTKEIGEGTGLGLSTVYGIIKKSNGHIKVYSQPDIGTAFKIYLPRTMEPEAKTEKHAVREEQLHGNEALLIVEDDDRVRNMTVKILKKYGYKIIEAENGDAGIIKCRDYAGKIDLIITDLIMPGMDGRQFIDRIAEFMPEIKVLFMSGYTFDTVANKGIIESEVNFLFKPYKPVELIQKVRNILN